MHSDPEFVMILAKTFRADLGGNITNGLLSTCCIIMIMV